MRQTVTVSVVGWQNPDNRLDVDPNPPGVISPSDAVVLTNELNFPTIIGPDGRLPAPPANPRYFYDVTGDGYLTPKDVLLVINSLNSGVGGEGNGEGEGEEAAAEASFVALAAMPVTVRPTSASLVSPTATSDASATSIGDSLADATVVEDLDAESLAETCAKWLVDSQLASRNDETSLADLLDVIGDDVW